MHPARALYTDPLVDRERLSLEESVLRADWDKLIPVRDAVKQALEHCRTQKLVGSSLQCSLVIRTEEGDNPLSGCLSRWRDELPSIFVVSSVHINESGPAEPSWSHEQTFDVAGNKGTLTVHPPSAAKCPRCWNYTAPEDDELCKRCNDVVAAIPT
jgi:isoleucyl-tRNA synthetase